MTGELATGATPSMEARWTRLDTGIGAAIALAGTVAALIITWAMHPVLRESLDVWFDSDPVRVKWVMLNPHYEGGRADLHPWVHLLFFGSIRVMGKSGIHHLTLIDLFNAMGAGVWLASLYFVTRIANRRRWDGFLVALLGASTSGWLFWAGVLEGHMWSAATAAPALALAALHTANGKASRFRSHVIASVVSGTLLVTTWFAGMLSALTSLGWKKAAACTLLAGAILAAGSQIQAMLFPGASVFPSLQSKENESEWILSEWSGGIARKAAAITCHSIVAPRTIVLGPHSASSPPEWNRLSVQHAMPGTGSAIALPVLLLWLLMVGFGVAGIASRFRTSPYHRTIAGMSIFTVALFLVYGAETFLYAPHAAMMFALLAAVSLESRRRTAARIAMAILIAASFIHNGFRLMESIRLVDEIAVASAPATQ